MTGAERERILALCHEQDRPGWIQQHGARLPRQLRTLVDHEDRAVRISQFEAVMIPGLLQTQDYARALMTEAGVLPTDEIGSRVSARLARQEILGRDQAEMFTFYVHEFALRLPVGGQAVHAEQLHHLLRLAVRPRLTVRVVPAALGGHAGIGGSFRLMEFANHRPVVYAESETVAAFLEQPVEIAAYRAIGDRLAETALDRRQSREFVATLATSVADGLED